MLCAPTTAWEMCQQMKLFVVVAVLLTVGCLSGSKQSEGQKLSEAEALALAVELANKVCDTRYSFAPFTESSYPIAFKDGRWHWGSLDLAGESGFSAIVSFGPRGEDQQVEVFLSIDTITPLRDEDDDRE